MRTLLLSAVVVCFLVGLVGMAVCPCEKVPCSSCCYQTDSVVRVELSNVSLLDWPCSVSTYYFTNQYDCIFYGANPPGFLSKNPANNRWYAELGCNANGQRLWTTDGTDGGCCGFPAKVFTIVTDSGTPCTAVISASLVINSNCFLMSTCVRSNNQIGCDSKGRIICQ